ncbi:MAG: radical SAM protein [Thermodesulfobacteriota bacterium]|nr:radical SAM protein [Thermodesulfobacteriota bacterium]
MSDKETSKYYCFEQGPIRPPSEAQSLLLRVTRNCPWNRCTFCPVYKGTRFSVRPVEHVKKDIDSVCRYVEILKNMAEKSDYISRTDIVKIAKKTDPDELRPAVAAFKWFSDGMRSVFIQDANSLIIKPADLIDILNHLKMRFPWIERITSYARSHTIARIKDDDLKATKDAGLNRIHIGLESGSSQVLKMVKKGVTKETHIKSGLKVKNAGMELSEYVMPSLGGLNLSDVHAIETADALNRINPHFIRLRSLAIPNGIPLFQDYIEGRFQKCTEIMMVKEILMLIENLDGLTSVVKSDHILNLFEDLEGTLPQDKEHMTNILKNFLAMPPEKQCLYQVGRRLGIFSGLGDMENSGLAAKAEDACIQLGINPENVDEIIDEMMKKFV